MGSALRGRGLDMTSGAIFRKILTFSLPLVLTNLLQMLYNVADMIVVGRFSAVDGAVGAIGCTVSFVNLINNFIFGLAMGATVTVAQAIGAGDRTAIRRGVSDYSVVMVLFAVVFALAMNRIRHSRIASTDTVIGVFSAVGVALGLALLSRGGNFANYQSLLIGDILSITPRELWVLGGALIVTAVVWLVCFNGFHAVSISPAVARSKGARVGLLDNLFVVLVAVVVMLAIRWVGLLLINAMLILPAAAARNVARSMRSYHLLSLIFGLFAGVLGLLLSYYNAVATGPMIILVQAALFFGTFVMRKK